MIQKLSFLTIGVQDLQRMKHFYQHTFGWAVMKDSDDIVFFKLNGFLLGLYPAHELAEDIGIAEDGSGFKRMTMAINLPTAAAVDEQFEALKAKGATVVKDPEKVFWGGYRGYIADPENNYWELAYNPYLIMDESGNVMAHQ